MTHNILLCKIKTTKCWGGDDLSHSTCRHRLVGLRKEKGWLQKDVVANLLKEYNISITESYYGMIERGVRTPSLKVALAIAALFNVEPIDIFLNVKTTFCCI